MAIGKNAKTGTWGINNLVKRPDGTYAHLNRRGYLCKKSADDDFRRLAKGISQSPKSEGGKKPDRSFDALLASYLSYKSTKVRLSSLEGAERLIRSHIAQRFSGRKASRHSKRKAWRGSAPAFRNWA
jgi:hypothetical protein